MLLFGMSVVLLGLVTSASRSIIVNAASANPWLQPSPYIMNAMTYEEFNVSIMVKNVLENLNLIGIQFELWYDTTSFNVTKIVNGPFLSQWAPYGTIATYYVEEDIGRVVFGEMIFPNATGDYDLTDYPKGEGEVAIITFKPTFLSITGAENLQYNMTLKPLFGFYFLDKTGEEIAYDPSIEFLYNYVFSYQPTPYYTELVFKAPEVGNLTATFTWDFGDGTIVSTNETIIKHKFLEPGTYTVKLSIFVYGPNVTNTLTRDVLVEIPGTPLDVEVEGGELYFKGEKADFYIMISDHTQRIDPSKITVLVYHTGDIIADLTNQTTKIDTGLYEVTYDIPIDASPGTYLLIVETENNLITETTIKSFQISPTLSRDLEQLKANLTAINATLVDLISESVNDVLTKLNITMSTLTAELDAINATLVDLITDSVNDVLAKLNTSLEETTTKLDNIQSTTTNTLYAASILSAIAVILAIAILVILYLRKKE